MLVIIHGWSDEAGSFKALAKRLAEPAPKGIGAEVTNVYLGDYLSLDDRVTLNDLVAALNRAWSDRGLGCQPGSQDVIVHSTGGLIIRDWLSQYFKPGQVPIKRLVMLAPANFGSPLAHTGRSVIGRAVKGWGGTRLFETGHHILKALELASPYSWQLAWQDLLVETPYYGAEHGLLCTVLVGNTGYRGISALANKPGSDGTVRVSTANLNIVTMNLSFHSGEDGLPTVSKTFEEVEQTAFAVVDGEDHSSIAIKGRGLRKVANWELIRDALLVEADSFNQWRARLKKHTEEVMALAVKRRGVHFHGYQNTVVRVKDDLGLPVNDYVIEFYMNEDKGQRDRRRTQRLQESVISSVHSYSDDSSCRCLLIDCSVLNDVFQDPDDRLNISITAFPEIGNKNKVGYKTYSDKDIGALSLDFEQAVKLFKENQTALISITVERHQSDDVFRLKRYQ